MILQTIDVITEILECIVKRLAGAVVDHRVNNGRRDYNKQAAG